MSQDRHHICVCICTYRRPALLAQLLFALKNQKTLDKFSYSIVIADNDVSEAGRPTAEQASAEHKLRIRYVVETEQSIAKARNRAVKSSEGDLLAFIDDDEVPDSDWLLKALEALQAFKVDGILGPVIPQYLGSPPRWVVQGKFYERETHETGTMLRWHQTRTGNVLMRKDVFFAKNNFFREQFGRGGEDRDLFKRLIQQGYKFVWCNEAVVREVISPSRYSRKFMLRRALVRGTLPHFRFGDYCKSLVAVPFYLVLLPFLIFLGQRLFMSILIKLFDHVGRLLSVMGLDVVKDRYVMD